MTASQIPSAPKATGGKVVLYTALFDVENADGARMPPNVVVAPLRRPRTRHQPQYLHGRVLVGGLEERGIKIGARDRLNGEVPAGLQESEALATGVRRDKAEGRLRW